MIRVTTHYDKKYQQFLQEAIAQFPNLFSTWKIQPVFIVSKDEGWDEDGVALVLEYNHPDTEETHHHHEAMGIAQAFIEGYIFGKTGEMLA